MIIQIISQNENMAEIVIKKLEGKRKDGSQKYSSKTRHVTLEELKRLKRDDKRDDKL